MQKARSDTRQRFAIVRQARTGHAGLDRRQIKLQQPAVLGHHRALFPPQPLGAHIGLDEFQLRRLAAARTQIIDGHPVHRKKRRGGAVFGRHVRHRRAIRERQTTRADAEKLDELAQHAMGTQHLGHAQNQVSGGDSGCKRATHVHADHIGNANRQGLTEHRRLRLDAAHAPRQNAQGTYHRRVAVGTQQRVRAGERHIARAFDDSHRVSKQLQVDLMNDPRSGRHHAKIGQAVLRPSHKTVTLGIARKVQLAVEIHGVGDAIVIDRDRMIDNQMHRDHRIDARRVAPARRHGIPHGGEISQGRRAGGVVHQHAQRIKRNLALEAALGDPLRDRRQRIGFVAQRVLKQHTQHIRDARERARGQRTLKTEQRIGLATCLQPALHVGHQNTLLSFPA